MQALFSATVGPLPAVLLCLLAVTCAVTDLWKGRIYNAVTYPAIALGFAVQIAAHGLPGLWSALGGFAVGFFPPFILFALGGMGGGDVKILAAVGAAAGAVAATEALVLGFFFGAFIGMAQLAWKGVLFKTLFRSLRFIAGMIVPGLPRVKLVPEGQTATMSRFGVAVCLAVLATLWDLRNAGEFSRWVTG
jgi:prepilin peptidase CpaA